VFPKAKALACIVGVAPVELHGLPVERHPTKVLASLSGAKTDAFLTELSPLQDLIGDGLDGLRIDSHLFAGAASDGIEVCFICVFPRTSPIFTNDLIAGIPDKVDLPGESLQ